VRNFALSTYKVFSRSVSEALFTLSVTLCLAPAIQAQVATTTQLTTSVPAAAVGSPMLPTAAVTDAASDRVHLGTSPAIAANYATLPLSFEANQGQTDPPVRFFSHGQGYSLFLTDT